MILPAKGGAGENVNVMCLNLRFGLADDGPNRWQHRKRAFPEMLKNHPCDFYAFQEANDFQITYLHALLDQWDFIGQRTPAPDYWQNNVIFHHRRWQCVYKSHFYLSDTPDVPSKMKDSRWPRQCTMGTFQCGGMVLTVVNTHFDFKAQVQHKSAMLIRQRLDHAASDLPVVLMGDFNAGPRSSCMAEFTAAPNGFMSAIWPPDMGTHHNFSGVPEGEPIDWILYRGNLEKRHAEIITRPFNHIFPSDHFPLKAGFRITPAD